MTGGLNRGALGSIASTGSTGSTVASPTGVAATDTAFIQAAIDAATAAGGGLVGLQAGTYVVTGLTLKDHVTLAGKGALATTIKLADGTNGDLLLGANYAAKITAKSGTPTTGGGLSGAGVRDLTLDGNRANNTSGDGLKVYGYANRYRDFRVVNCAGVGMRHDWGASGTAVPTDASMECHTTGFEIANNTAGGIQWNGPNDSEFSSGIVHENGVSGAQSGGTTVGVDLLADGAGPVLTNVHVWGRNQKFAIRILASNALFSNCEAESGDISQVEVLANGMDWSGGWVFRQSAQAASSLTASAGFRIGDNTHPVSWTSIRTITQKCEAGAVQFVNDSGNGTYSINAYQPVGTAITGTPGSNNDYSGSSVNGGGTLGVSTSASSAAYEDLPTDHGFVAWGYNPDKGSASFTVPLGRVDTLKAKVPNTVTLANLIVYVNTAGVTLTSGQTYGGVYLVSGSTATLIAKTADQSSLWTSTGLKTMALTVEAGQSLTVAGGSVILLALLQNGTTGAAFKSLVSATGALWNAGTTGVLNRFGSSGTGQTAMPASATSGTFGNSGGGAWCAVS